MQAAQDEIRHPRVGMGEENNLEIITKNLGWLGKHFVWADSDLSEPRSSKIIQLIA